MGDLALDLMNADVRSDSTSILTKQSFRDNVVTFIFAVFILISAFAWYELGKDLVDKTLNLKKLSSKAWYAVFATIILIIIFISFEPTPTFGKKKEKKTKRKNFK